MTFRKKIDAAATRADSLLCVGLDPAIESFPPHLVSSDIVKTIVDFNREIINATSDLVCAYKPNLGFYIAHGVAGIEALIETRNLIDRSIPVILDCKLGDFSNTSANYAAGIFGMWDFDAVTIAPYMGEDGLAPFMAEKSRGVFVLCKTSNSGSAEFQDIPVRTDGADELLFERVAARSKSWNDTNPATVGLVVGATYPDHLRRVREICPDQLILLPGIGSQQGDLQTTVQVGVDANGLGLIPSSSRGITYVSKERNFAKASRAAAEELVRSINEYRGG